MTTELTPKQKAIKIITGFMVVALGAVLTAGLEYLKGVDFGQYTPFVVMAASTAVNAARVYFGLSFSEQK